MNRMPITSKQRFVAFCDSSRNEEEPATGRRSALAAGERRQQRWRVCRDWLRPHRRTLSLVMALGLSSIAIDMIWPLVSRYLIDRVILLPGLPLSVKLRQIVLFSAGIAALFIVNSVFDLWRSFRSQLLDSRFSSALRARLFRRVLRLPMADINELKTGGVISRLSNDVDHTTGLLQTALFNPTLSAVRLIATLAVIFTLDWRISAAMVLAVPPIVIAQNVWLRRSRLS